MQPSLLTTVENCLGALTRLGLGYKVTEHPPLHTVADSEHWHEVILGAHAKNLFVKDKKSRMFLISARAHAAIDLKHVHGVIGASGRLSFGSADKMFELLGVKPGSVTPFGVMNDHAGQITVVLEAALMQHELLNFHPLQNTATVTIRREDVLTFLRYTGHEPLIVPLPLLENTGESVL